MSSQMMMHNLSDYSKKWNRDLLLSSGSFKEQFPWIQIIIPLLEAAGQAPIMWLGSQNSWPVSPRKWIFRQFANDFLLPISTTLEVS